jgi:hypothetical protein
MSSFNRLIKELQTKGAGSKAKTHTQTVSLDDGTHNKLVALAESLTISKTGLASRLLTAAIEDMSTTTLTAKEVAQAQVSPVVRDPLSTLPSPKQALRGNAGHRHR